MCLDMAKKTLEELRGVEYVSASGERRSCKTTYIAESGAENKLSSLALSLACVGSVISFVTYADRTLECVNAERALRRSGYMVSRIEIKKENERDKLALDNIFVAEETRIFVAYDAGVAALYLSTKYDKKIINIFSDPSQIREVCGYVDLVENGLFLKTKVCFPSVVLVDYDVMFLEGAKGIVSSFSNIFSLVLQQFDARVNARILGVNYSPTLANCATEICKIALDAFGGVVKADRHLGEIIVDLDMRLSAVRQLVGNDECFEGGERQLSRVIKQLFLYEKRAIYSDAENDFIFSNIAAKIYRQTLETVNFGFIFPPNNNKRIERISEYLGLADVVSASLFSKNRQCNYALELYRMNEYRDEFMDEIIDINNLFALAYKKFKRLYEDDGFALLTYIDEQDLCVCLALAPDLSDSFTFLSQMKNMGLLEKYL